MFAINGWFDMSSSTYSIESALVDPSISADYMAYMFKYDSTYGKFKGEVSHANDKLIINGHKIMVSAQ